MVPLLAKEGLVGLNKDIEHVFVADCCMLNECTVLFKLSASSFCFRSCFDAIIIIPHYFDSIIHITDGQQLLNSI